MERNYSAADLIKCTARQMVYYADRKERYATYLQMRGIEYQSKIVADEKNRGIVADEMRGCYKYKEKGEDISIFFCIDMIKDGKFYEIKMNNDKEGNVRHDYDEWYLNLSLLQAAFYKSLLLRMSGNVLYTPKFRVKEGFEKAKLEVDKTSDYILRFGEIGDFVVDVTNPDAIIRFYKYKIRHLGNYDTASDFDANFRRREFERLKRYIVWRKLTDEEISDKYSKTLFLNQ